MLNNIFTGIAVLSIFASSYVQYVFHVEQVEMHNKIVQLETKIHDQKMDIKQLRSNQNMFEDEVSDAWQKHEDELQMIKVGLGLLK